jgi:molybdopterin-guanine dinucleotide biosynthesis protein A
MGGVDKGLQTFGGTVLARWALERLALQVGCCMVNANRNREIYAAWGAPVWSDRPDLDHCAGPLAGILTALEHCSTPYLLTVPCDSPIFPADLAERLAQALVQADADIAVACSVATDGTLQPQPVFCLLHTGLHNSLERYLQSGGRKVDAWTMQHKAVQVPFDRTDDDPLSFGNANTVSELQQLQCGFATPIQPTALP